MNAYWNAPISDPLSSLCARVFSPAAAILENPEDEVAKGQFYCQLHRRKMSAHALLKITRDVFRAMSLAPRQKYPRNVVEMKEVDGSFFWQ